MKKLYALFATITVALSAWAQTNPPPQLLPYAQDFSSLNSPTVTVYPDGWQGWTISTTPGGTFSTAAPTGDRPLTASGTAASTSAAVYNYTGKIGFQNTGSADLSIALALNTTGNTNVQVTYDVMTVQNKQDASNSRINEVTLQYRVGTSGTFTTLTGVEYQNNNVNQTSGTAPQNTQTKTANLPAACNNQPVVQVRWISRQVSGGGNRPSFAIDNVSAGGSTGGDITPPNLVSISPANNSTGAAQNLTVSLSFDETVAKGTGNIYLKKSSDNSIVRTINISAGTVTVSGTMVSVSLNPLQPNTSYYITIDNGAITDAASNAFAGISGATAWAFSTGNALFVYDFSACLSTLSDGFTQQSVTGAEVWTCKTEGRSGNDVEMNGYNAGYQLNEDWLISPALDLSATTYPVLSFYSKTYFGGDPLRLYVTANYTGNVTTTTWTELNGFFPAINSDTWTLSDNIDLSAYKQANVRFAFKYTSNSTTGAKWRLDDIAISNSATPAQPVFNISSPLLDFRQVDAGTNSASKSFTFSVANLNASLTLTAPTGFEISKDQSTYSSSLTYTPVEMSNSVTVYARFTPSLPSTVFSGNLQFNAPGFSRQAVLFKGNSYATSSTLNVVNWNIEWFGSSSLGPTDDALQQANAKKVMDYLDADVYAVAEIVDVTRFGNLVGSLNNSYSYVIGQYCSGGATAGACASSQKLALAYKTSVLSNVTARPILFSSATALSNFASGRVPFLVTANVTKNGQTSPVNFIVVHAKANTGSTSDQIAAYNSRKAGNQELKDTLDTYFANANIVILGDYNDNLIGTIAPTTGPDTVSSYQAFVIDSTDANSYRSLTLPLSALKLASTADNPGMIDHVIISNEMASRYVGLSASLYNDIGSLAGITNYSTTTSDHYPVMTRFLFGGTLPVGLVSFTAVKEASSVKLSWITSQEVNTKEFVVERSLDGVRYEAVATVAAKGNSAISVNYSAIDARPAQGLNYYRLKTVDADGKSTLSNVVKINFAKGFTVNLSPNPATDYVLINLAGTQKPVVMQLVNASGKLMKTTTLKNGITRMETRGLAKGLYVVRFTGLDENYTEKLIVQ